jgi:hypothetical protein
VQEVMMPFLTLLETMEPTNVGDICDNLEHRYKQGYKKNREDEGKQMVMFHDLPFKGMNSFGVPSCGYFPVERNHKAFTKTPKHLGESQKKDNAGDSRLSNHKAFTRAPSRVSEKRHDSDLHIKAYLQEKLRQERYESKSSVKQDP